MAQSSKEETIKRYMEHLNISYEEAVQLYEDDKNDFIGDEGEEMQTKAKQTQHREKADTPNKKRTSKERKIDPDKKYLFDMTYNFLSGLELNETIIGIAAKTETEITFTYKGAEYTWKLTKHRPPK